MVRILPRSLSMPVVSGRACLKAQSPESSDASGLFSKMVDASTVTNVLALHRSMCEKMKLQPGPVTTFFPCLKKKLLSHKFRTLKACLEEKANHLCYSRGTACSKIRVLIIGAGPAGLRTAIECQLLGAKVVVLEKRPNFSRNNVLHLWPFIIQDLKSLGAKVFYGLLGSGSIDHISIRRLQLILLKVALLLGVEVYENVTFEELFEPPEDQSKKTGWRARVSPESHIARDYEFDVLIGAGGSSTILPGFVRTEARHKLAIAVTANFTRNKADDAGVPEITGVSFIYNQKFFQEMKRKTNVDLENIVYYKDETHYFIMTAKKASLLEEKVFKTDHKETDKLLGTANIELQNLKSYVKKAAHFATLNRLPNMEFATTSDGRADVSIFDFTQLYRSDRAAEITMVRDHILLMGLVGDSLFEPFWPIGSGCAYAVLSAMDTAWMIRSLFSGHCTDIDEVMDEREHCYSSMRESKPDNMMKDHVLYSLEPESRYTNFLIKKNMNRRSAPF